MRKKHLKKQHLETWPTKEREARFILRSLAAKISKRKRHDTTRQTTTRHDTTRDDTHTHTPTTKKTQTNKQKLRKVHPEASSKYEKKQLQKTSKKPPKIDQTSVKNDSRSSPGDPSGQRPVFDVF